MPTTFRLIFSVCVLAALGVAAIYFLANYIEPTPQPISIVVPTDQLQ